MHDDIACRFDKNSFHSYCDILAAKDADLKKVLQQFGYPPLWMRKASFATLVRIILEQQVSLSSAKAAFLQLQKRIRFVTAARLLELSDAELKACYFSRQKAVYARELAKAVVARKLSFKKIQQLPASEIRSSLKNIKGIGDWTVDIFLMMCLQEPDVFPVGDIALIKSMREVKGLSQHVSIAEIKSIADGWQPYRTVAAFMLYHAYLTRRNRTD